MNTLSLKSLIEWHTEQRNELDREQDQEIAFEFHSDAVDLLNAIYWHLESKTHWAGMLGLAKEQDVYELTEKGKEATK